MRRAALLGTLVLPLACAMERPSDELLESLRRIDTISLPDESLEEPVDQDSISLEEEQKRIEASRIKGPTLDLSIEEVRKAALENNLQLKVVLVDPVIGDTFVSEEEARFEGTFFSSGQYSETRPSVTPLTAQPLDIDAGQAEIGASFPLRTGGVVTVRLPLTWNDSTVNIPMGDIDIDDFWQSSLEFSMSQPILRNAGYDVNTAPISIAEFSSAQTDARTKLAAIRILANAGRAYWNYYAAVGEVEVRFQQYQNAVKQLNAARRLAQMGVVAEVEVDRAASGVAQRIDFIIVSDTRRKIAGRDLKRIMNMVGVDVGSPIDLVPVTEPNPLRLVLDGDALARRAVENRMEMVDLELQLAVDSITVDVAKNRILPAFALEFDYSFRGAGQGLGNALGDIFDDDNNELRAGALLEVPLGNRAARARLRRAVLQRVSTQSTYNQRALTIRQEVYDSLDQLKRNWQSILAAREATLLSARAYEGEFRQFQAGVRTSTDVLIASDFLADSQIREIDALAGYEIANIEIAFATGTLLGKDRVRLVPYGSP
jgi:outer membrane protein TolC